MTRNIRALIAYANISQSELAKRLNTSQSNFANKMRRDNWTEKDLIEIANVCGANLEQGFSMQDSKGQKHCFI